MRPFHRSRDRRRRDPVAFAEQIARDHVGQDVLLLGILKGAVHVLSDLARALDGLQPGPARVYLDLMAVSSYGNASRSSGEVRLIQDTTHAVEGRRVVIVEDIIDNGHTLMYLNALLSARKLALPTLGGLARQALPADRRREGGLRGIDLS